jgi:hypothetical protein
VLSSAVPIEPPTCWLVLTIAEATPASLRSTPSVAVLIAGAKIEAEADAHDEQAGQDVRGVGRVDAELGEAGHAAPRERMPA